MPNKYNPNRMTEHDRALLKQSILEDGWTQPIVVLPDNTVVDGEQRWTVSGMPVTSAEIQEIIDKMNERQQEGYEVSDSILARLGINLIILKEYEEKNQVGTLAALTQDLVPITGVEFSDKAHQMISTIRHNRARGNHQVDIMADITADLKRMGLDFDDLFVRLGMTDEEAHRMLSTADKFAEILEGAPSVALDVTHYSALSDEEKTILGQEFNSSDSYMKEAQDYQAELAKREGEIRVATESAISAAEAAGKHLTSNEKVVLREQAESNIPNPEKPAPPTLRKIMFFVTEPEYLTACERLGDPPNVNKFLEML